MPNGTVDIISAEEAGTLPGLFRERVRRTPDGIAYRQYDESSESWFDTTWSHMAHEVARWQAAFSGEDLSAGDRVAVLLRNCREWVIFDQAALGCGLVLVPLYTEDRAENIAYILQNAGVKVLLLEGEEHWERLQSVRDKLGHLTRVLSLHPINAPEGETRLRTVSDWLPVAGGELLQNEGPAGELATIVYTSGTTGRPKGVMLSHRNIVWNAWRCSEVVRIYTDDILMSFLPLSHTFERTAGYYLPIMTGATVAYARSIPQLAEDLQLIKPTLMISVPRIFERVYNKIQAQLDDKPPVARKLFEITVDIGWKRFLHQQGRGSWRLSFLLWPVLNHLVASKIIAKLGGRMRLAVSGGAALPPKVAQTFIGLGLPLIQGYGLTETSPVISANYPDDNEPASIGVPLQDVECRLGEDDDLLIRSPGIMLGYWDNPEATRDIIDDEGWLHTGDKVRIQNRHIYITGRLKEILVLANGEKVPPADMEMAILLDPLFEQVMIIGDNRPYLCALLVFNPEQWEKFARSLNLDPADSSSLENEDLLSAVLDQLHQRLATFPGYAQVRQVSCTLEPWSIESGLITPTLKLRRDQIMDYFADKVEKMYEGH